MSQIPKLNKESQIGLVFPIYAWGVPEVMNEFAKNLEKTEVFTFGICTCGADAGIDVDYVLNLAQHQQLHL